MDSLQKTEFDGSLAYKFSQELLEKRMGMPLNMPMKPIYKKDWKFYKRQGGDERILTSSAKNVLILLMQAIYGLTQISSLLVVGT